MCLCVENHPAVYHKTFQTLKHFPYEKSTFVIVGYHCLVFLQKK